MEPGALVQAYYEAIDEDEYERLAELLDPEFTQVRGDRTFEHRDAFVRFMRDDRPAKDTTHELEHVTADGDRVVAEGTLYRGDGSVFFYFADAFTVEDGQLQRLETYTRSA